MPRPHELEITVLAYAPHFLGLAAATANEAFAYHSANGGFNGEANTKVNGNTDGNIGTNANGKIDGGKIAECSRSRKNHSSEGPSGGNGGGGGGGSVAVLRAEEGGGGWGEGGVWTRCVPVGLSEGSVWLDEEAGRKEADLKRYQSDPVKVRAWVDNCCIVLIISQM